MLLQYKNPYFRDFKNEFWELGRNDGEIHYVLYGMASTYAQLKRANEAVKNLELAFEYGFDDF